MTALVVVDDADDACADGVDGDKGDAAAAVVGLPPDVTGDAVAVVVVVAGVPGAVVPVTVVVDVPVPAEDAKALGQARERRTAMSNAKVAGIQQASESDEDRVVSLSSSSVHLAAK